MEGEMEITQIIDQLALQILSLEADDVMAMGLMLTQIEEAEKAVEGTRWEPILEFFRPLKGLIEKLVLMEVPDPKAALALISEGLRIVQNKIVYDDPNRSVPEEGAFMKRVEAVLGPMGKGAGAEEKEEGKKEEQSEEATAELSQDLDLFNDFVTESMEHLESIEINLINLEQSPEDKEYLNAIFRPFHTIKGVSGFLNLQDIHKFAHAVESLLDDARNDVIRVNQRVIDLILEAVDFLKNLILERKAQVQAGHPLTPVTDLSPWLERIEKVRQGALAAEGPKEEEEPVVPPLGELLTFKGVVPPEAVGEALENQIKGKHDQKIGEILIAEQKAKPKDVIEGLRDQKRLTGSESQATIRVDTKKLDNLVDMVGELVIAQSLVQQNPVLASLNDQKLIRDFSQLKRITSDLQKIAMSLRMVPIRNTFQKMIRLVRDLSKKSGKLVELSLFGEETEIDRNMVDTLYDPLVHMIRNAIDHGIELPQVRKEKGKPETGEIRLKAYQKGGNIVIEIEDDGQGLNRAKILKKAKERRIISEENGLTDQQIDNLIFEPGFSTADKVTDVSGRGVGMDVVKRVIEKIRGKIEIFSTEGQGCRFIIRIPLTLAIMDGILVKIGSERFIIPTVSIKETLRPSPEEVFTVGKKEEMVKVRNTLLPLVRLNTLLRIPSEEKKPWEGLVVVVENDGAQKGLMVDDLLGKQEVVIKNLGEKLKNLQGVAGGAILGDGQISLILDVNGIFEIYRGKSA